MLNSKPRGSEGSTKYRRVPLCAVTMSSSENKPISLSRKSRLQSEAVRAKRELISLVAVSRRKKHGKTSKGSLMTKNQKGNRTRTISRRMEYLNNNKKKLGICCEDEKSKSKVVLIFINKHIFELLKYRCNICLKAVEKYLIKLWRNGCHLNRQIV